MRPPRPILALYAIGIAFGPIAGLNYVVTSAMGIERFDFLRLGVETNLPTWFSTVQLFLVAMVFGLIAWRDTRTRSPRTWPATLPALFFLLLSLDEGGQVHERLGWWLEAQTGLGSDLITGAWLFIALPLYIVLGLFVTKSLYPYVRGRRKVMVLGVSGCVMFVIGAAGFEALGNFTAADNEMARRILGVFEEVGEMVAATTLLWAGFELARLEGFRLIASGVPTSEKPALTTSGDGASGVNVALASGDGASGDGARPDTATSPGDGRHRLGAAEDHEVGVSPADARFDV